MLTEDELNWIRQVLSTDDSTCKLTEDELNWLKQVLGDDYEYDPIKLSPYYVRYKKTNFERNANKEIVRKELDALRKKMKKFIPEELIEPRTKRGREELGIENFAGIYIIHNRTKNRYYCGKSERVFDRAYKHFVTDPAENKARYEGTIEFNLPEIYDDYRLGDTFNISLIPLENTSFSSLNEFEDNAIRAYDSLVPHGYNRVQGNIRDKPIFRNDDYQKVADLLLDKIKGTELFSTLSNRKKRLIYTSKLLSDLGMPNNWHFISNFAFMIQEYQKANKKGKK